LEWHRADPVSAKEIKRNEAVYQKQGNRNPYVDHPELAEHIWGTLQHTQWDGGGTPIVPIEKLDPVMLAVDEAAVTGTSFRADWTSGGDVSSYTLKVSRSQESGATLLLSEGFSGVNANSDGHDDLCGDQGTAFDNYTDNSGWTGSKVYAAAGQGVKLGTSSQVGYIQSPDLQLGSTVTVVVNSKSWVNSKGVSDGSSVQVSCGDVSQTAVLSTTAEDYTLVLHDCHANNVKISTTAPAKRLYVYNVDIYNGDLTTEAPHRAVIEEGDSTWRMVSGIVDEHYTVNALAEGYYEYMVKAIYTDGTESVWSNIEHVTLTGIGDEPLIGDVNADGEVNIADVTALINILLSNDQPDMDSSDINHDGEVSIGDVTALINLLLKGQA